MIRIPSIPVSRSDRPTSRASVRLRTGLHMGVIAVAASTTVLAAPPPALAESVARIAVSYRDLDLTRAEDLSVLRRRIAAAARTLCGPAPHLTPACVVDVTRNTRPQIEAAVARREMAAAAGRARAALSR